MMNFIQIKEKLSYFTVGIAGAGGLGSNCAAALVRVGIGKIIIADFDIIEESNLNRQFYFHHQIGQKKVLALKENLLLINPDANIEIHDLFLKAEVIVKLFQNCDVIVEAFDKAEQKKMIIETVLSCLPHIPLIVGLGMSGWGNSNVMKMRQEGNLFICGDEVSEVGENKPPLSPRVGIAANIQANTVLEILLKNQK